MCESSTSSAAAAAEPVRGQLLHSSSEDYSLLECIGEGNYGKVLRCQKLKTKETVAVKVMKDGFQQALEDELSILEIIRNLDVDRANIIRFHESFVFRGCGFLVFEMLDMDLYTLMDHRDWEPLSVCEIRPIAEQMLVALDFLKDIGIIHADIKPDNIMVVRRNMQPLKVKLIDFGVAIQTSSMEPSLLIQPLGFRAPEVSIGLPFSEAVDVWGLGCVLALLFIGENLFHVDCKYQSMKTVVELIGLPTDKQLHSGLHSSLFFYKPVDASSWRLMTPEEFEAANNIVPGKQYEVYFSCFDDLVYLDWGEKDGEAEEREAFVDLLKQLLCVDGERRISPRQALLHHVFIPSHLHEKETSREPPNSSQADGAVSSKSEDSTYWSFTCSVLHTFSEATKATASEGKDSFSLNSDEGSHLNHPSRDQDQFSAEQTTFLGSLRIKIQRFLKRISRFFICCCRPSRAD